MPVLLIEDGLPERRHRKHLTALLSRAKDVIRIATAYVTDTQLLSTVTIQDMRLLISLSPVDVASGATKLEAVNGLLKLGVQCRELPSRPRLHAKVYICDNSRAVVTSANLTMNAFESNIEVGVEIEGEQVNELRSWFDHLWEAALPLTETRIAALQSESASLRRDFAKWRRRVRATTGLKYPNLQAFPTRDALQDAFEGASRVFVCNTDRRHKGRTPTGGFELEEAMRLRGYAAAWETFKYPTHMKSVEGGDVILMFAKGVGIVGVGVAEGPCETLSPIEEGRVSNVYDEVEWRIPTRWLAWTDSEGAFRWKAPNCTFWDVSGDQYADFLGDVVAHFVEAD